MAIQRDTRKRKQKSHLLQAAGAIHGDFERGFICAEVMKYDELKELGSEAAVKVRETRQPFPGFASHCHRRA